MANRTAAIAVCLGLLLLLATPAAAFGAGNIASIAVIEGSRYRHGDIEDMLKTIAAVKGTKWTSMMIKRVYFGNWLRDYSQAVDVGTLKGVQANAIRILVWILSFLSFGYATREFEVTEERLGVYRPEEHIDNPEDYADNVDARQYDKRLRGPIQPAELDIDPESGMKNYIANERGDWATSSGYVRFSFTRSIHYGRLYTNGAGGTKGQPEDLYEALRCLGQGLHCLEDFGAHSNYCELALREIGYLQVFPHVGEATELQLHGRQLFPLVTGTFGGVDFLHSVLGEAGDHIAQSQVSEIEQMKKDMMNASADNKKHSGMNAEQQASGLTSMLQKMPGCGHLCDQAVNLQKASNAEAITNASRGIPDGVATNEDVSSYLPPEGVHFHGEQYTRADPSAFSSGPAQDTEMMHGALGQGHAPPPYAEFQNPQQQHGYDYNQSAGFNPPQSSDYPPQHAAGSTYDQPTSFAQPQSSENQWQQQPSEYQQTQYPQQQPLAQESQYQFQAPPSQEQHVQQQQQYQPSAFDQSHSQQQPSFAGQGQEQPQQGASTSGATATTATTTTGATAEQAQPAQPTGVLANIDLEATVKKIYPILQFRDDLVRKISAIVETIPGLEQLIETISEKITLFIMGLLAPYIVPLINAASAQLKTGSGGVIKASAKHQYAPWDDPICTAPTHSMLSKDHFSNVLNNPAGKVATVILQYAAPRVIYAWEHPGVPVEQVLDDIVGPAGAFHHPALRRHDREIHQNMFNAVRKWADELGDKTQITEKLTSMSVKKGTNHTAGAGGIAGSGLTHMPHVEEDANVTNIHGMGAGGHSAPVGAGGHGSSGGLGGFASQFLSQGGGGGGGGSSAAGFGQFLSSGLHSAGGGGGGGGNAGNIGSLLSQGLHAAGGGGGGGAAGGGGGYGQLAGKLLSGFSQSGGAGGGSHGAASVLQNVLGSREVGVGERGDFSYGSAAADITQGSEASQHLAPRYGGLGAEGAQSTLEAMQHRRSVSPYPEQGSYQPPQEHLYGYEHTSNVSTPGYQGYEGYGGEYPPQQGYQGYQGAGGHSGYGSQQGYQEYQGYGGQSEYPTQQHYQGY